MNYPNSEAFISNALPAPRRRIRYAQLALLLLTGHLAACTTIVTLGEPATRNKVYSGTVRQFELKCAHGTCIDLPFSLLADTMLLPITIPWTAVNLMRKPPEAATDAVGNPSK